MGRMLESLKHGEHRRIREKHFFEDSLERELHAAEAAKEDEVPFVEVGPNKAFEASHAVLAVHPAQPSVQPPHVRGETKEMAVAADWTEAAPMKIAFEPWPTGRSNKAGIAPEIIVHHQPEHPISRQYAQLLDQMLETYRVDRPVLLFSASKAQVGASTVVLNLAAAAARRGNGQVVAIDARQQKPGLAGKLGLDSAGGLNEVLMGSLALEQALVPAGLGNLQLVPATSTDAKAARPEAIRWILAALRERFDLILIDGPTLETPEQAAAWNAGSDGLYLVAPQGEQPRVPASIGGRLKGVVHTHVEG